MKPIVPVKQHLPAQRMYVTMTDDPTLRFHDDATTKPTLETVLERINDFRGSVEGRLGMIEDRLGTVEDRLETMEARLDRVQGEVLAIKSDFRDFRKEIRDRFPRQ
jgi:archaellum component FlaC